MGWFSCFEPRKPTPPTIVRSAISHPLEASKPTNNLRYPTSRVDEGLQKWKEANERRLAEEQRAYELEIQTYHQRRNQRRQISGVQLSPGHYNSSSQRQQRELSSKSNPRPNSGVEQYPPYCDDRSRQNVISGIDQQRQTSGVELSPGHYDSSSQHQQHEPTSKSNPRPNSSVEQHPPYYDDHRRQKVMSSVDQYPAFEEIVEHERQAPRSIFERFDHGTDNPRRRPNSGVEHYAPMEVIDEHERPNPLALDSVYVMASEQLEGQANPNAGRSLTHTHNTLQGQADPNAGRSLTHTHKPGTGRGRQEPWNWDSGLKPKISGSPTRQDDGSRRQGEKPRQKGPIHQSSQQTSGRERSGG